MRFLGLAFTISLAAVGTLSGCSSEDYFCDDTGCYFCDGLGCRAAETPDRSQCGGDYACPDGTVCTDTGCVASCTEDSECAAGTTCRDGLCLNPAEVDPTLNPGACETTADCGDDSLICLDGLCELNNISCGEEGCSCAESGLCSDGFSCVDDECRPEDDVCQFNHDCGGGLQVCVNGACAASCAVEGVECPVGQDCGEDGFCVDAPATLCDGTECAEGQTCVDTTCFDTCDLDGDCGEGRYCTANGVCEVDDRASAFCPENPCAHECVDGVCRTPCTSSEECSRFDHQFTFCGEEGYCQTTNEVTSNCQLSIDCDDDSDACIDGICR